MFLLFLIGLGTAHVNAQVRIGGNAAPNGAAVLDLNATDAATGTKGLALPRVRLDSVKMQITPGIANLNGMLVYNTTATLGAGIYFWNNTAWVRANLPATSSLDTGKFLMSNGSTWILASPNSGWMYNSDTLHVLAKFDTIAWVKVLDTTLRLTSPIGRRLMIITTGMRMGDFCVPAFSQNNSYAAGNDKIVVASGMNIAIDQTERIRCYRPSK